MPRYDFRSPRLFTEEALRAGHTLGIGPSHVNYLRNVLRLGRGDAVLVFNGRDGEWRAILADAGKRTIALKVEEPVREQTAASDLHYLFAPLKHARLDYMIQKAVEMGVAKLQPVLTRHGQVARVNLERMRANAIEAAEQCGILTLPQIDPPVAFEQMIAARNEARLLVFCDEEADIHDPVAALADARRRMTTHANPPALAVLVGPEGGFSAEERASLLRLPNVARLALGPRILRADTAAVAALTLVQSVLGDWR